MDPLDLATIEREVQAARARGTDRDPIQLIRWAHALLGERLMMSTAFGKSGMVLLHMVREIAPALPVYFLDTSFHFVETMEYAEKLRREWEVNLILKRPRLYGESFKKVYGQEPYRTDPDLCCHKNKVEPFAEILAEFQGWIAGVRRDQGATRAEAEAIEILEGAKLKLQPLVHWERPQVEGYIRKFDIPLHPLFSQGYTSIGCAPCTQPCSNPSEERAGRWVGLAKKECGLHTSWKDKGKTEGTVEFVGKVTSANEEQPALGKKQASA